MSDAVDLTELPPRETQWSIVKRLFSRNRSAVWGLKIVKLLVLIAVGTPILASGVPVVWRAVDTGQELTFPWFTTLFDRRVWEYGLDRFFNVLMAGMLVYGVVWVLLTLATGSSDARKRVLMLRLLPLGAALVAGSLLWPPAAVIGGTLLGFWLLSRIFEPTHRVLARVRKPFAIALFVLGFLQALPPSVLEGGPLAFLDVTTSSTRIAHADVARQYDQLAALRADPDAARAELAEQMASAKALGDTQAADEAATWLERLDESTDETVDYQRVMTLVPYGYREQGQTADDMLVKWFDFSQGAHVLGTDRESRDVLARAMYGTRIGLTIGVVAVGIYITIGTILGALAGFFGGWVDLVIMRVVEVLLCIPGLFLLLTIIALFDRRTIFLIMAAIGFVGWTGTTRLVRGEFLRERKQEYVEAARMLGFGRMRIIFRHVLPNALGPVLVTATFGVASAILTESSLSFLGLGDPSVPSWGGILNQGREEGMWHLIVPPSVAIFFTVTALNLVGDGVRDALDPKMRK